MQDRSRIFRFWAPMAGTWLMMAAEAPFLAAVIARLDEPKHNLAAFGLAYAVAILVESPVIMMLSASTALVQGPVSLRRLRRFGGVLNAAITLGMLLLLLTPAWRWLAGELIAVPSRVVELTQIGLLILLPWPAAIGYRRFYQGLLIRSGMTRRVAYGTVVRLATMAVTALGLFAGTELPGTWVAATALAFGVSMEAIAARVMATGAVRELSGTLAEDTDHVSYRRIASFYAPLALTSMISLVAHPMVTFFMGRARFPLESLAVLPVVNSLSFIFRAVGLSYQEVAIALLARDRESWPAVRRFGNRLAVGASLTMAAIVFTPLADVWFRSLSGLSEELTRFALPPARILAVLPAFSVWLSIQRAILVQGRKTGPVTWATLLEIAGIAIALLVCIGPLGLVGATAAAVAFIAGRLGANAYLIPPCRAALAMDPRRRRRSPP